MDRVTAELVGGPRDGELRQLREPIAELRMPRPAVNHLPTLDAALLKHPEPVPPMIYRRRTRGPRVRGGNVLYDYVPELNQGG
jgi:hypothetical protein